MGLSLNAVWGDVVMLLVLGIIYTLLGVGVGFLRSLFRKRSA